MYLCDKTEMSMVENTVAQRKMELPGIADTKFTRVYTFNLKFLFNVSTDQLHGR